MSRLKYLIIFLSLTTICLAVRINMQGSVSLGKEVLETISHYMKRNSAALNRRSMSFADNDSERIKWTVQSAHICKSQKICTGPLGTLIRDYVILLATAIESIFDGVLAFKNEKEMKGAVFADPLKPVLYEINDLLQEANDKIEEDNELLEWMTVLKRISGKFQKTVVTFVAEKLDGDPHDIQDDKKKLIQKMILAIVLVENKYEKRLCDEHQICEKEHECTKALNSILEEFESVHNEKAMEFIKYFYENIPDRALSFLGSETAHEFQVVLSDLSYTKDAPAKEILNSVYKAVDRRLKYFKNSQNMSKAYDQQLVHVILSDLDYIYHNKRKIYPFDNFLGSFTGWIRLGGKFNQQMKQILKDLSSKISDQHSELLEKLHNEVRVFLELTVDPDD